MRCAVAGLVLLGGCLSKPGAPGDAPIEANYMFTTSRTFTMSMTTVADADGHCMDAARDAGLPGSYVAWLSTAEEPAPNRFAGARGWIRTDGEPFARSMTDILQHKVLQAPRFDEHAQDLFPRMTLVATGTDPDGTQATDNCNGFTGGGNLRVGLFDGVWPHWTAISAVPCSTMTHLYCFGIDLSVDIPVGAPAGKLAFVTASTYAPASLTAADDACTAEGGNDRSFTALLAPSGASAKSRATSMGPFYRPDGTMVSMDLTVFPAPISQTRAGSYERFDVWFGAKNTTDLGNSVENCGNWTGSGVSPHLGDSARTSGSMFSQGGSTNCATPHHLYCVEN